ncbi:MAG: glutaminyl-peptide cyclotransferase [Halioglobus sp.]
MPPILITLFIALTVQVQAQAQAQAQATQHYSYEILETRPQSRQNFVQGLQIVGDYLYVGTGLYGQSAILRYRLDDGTLDASKAVSPQFFGEGITVVDDLLYQLTWKSRMLLVYRASDLTPQKWFQIPGEGWGITYNGEALIYSDGSHNLHFLSPDTGNISHSIEVMEHGEPVIRLNELEWVDGKVWANVWASNRIVIIDPETGEVTGSIDLTGLLPADQRQPGTDVLNGIAVNPANGDIWVTGKRWPALYRIKLVPIEKTQIPVQTPVESGPGTADELPATSGHAEVLGNSSAVP